MKPIIIKDEIPPINLGNDKSFEPNIIEDGAYKQETIAQEAYRLLKDVDTNIWIEMFMSNGCGVGCALGQYNRLKSKDITDFSEQNMAERYMVSPPSINLREISTEFLHKKYNLTRVKVGELIIDIATINNGHFEDYQESTPKERVLHLLTDMIEAGY